MRLRWRIASTTLRAALYMGMVSPGAAVRYRGRRSSRRTAPPRSAVGNRRAACTERHGDVYCCEDVVDQLMQGQGGSTAQDGARSPCAHGQQIRVRRLRGVCPPVHPAGQFVRLRFRDQARQIARGKQGLTCLRRRECGGEAGQPLLQARVFRRVHISNGTPRAGSGDRFDTSSGGRAAYTVLTMCRESAGQEPPPWGLTGDFSGTFKSVSGTFRGLSAA